VDRLAIVYTQHPRAGYPALPWVSRLARFCLPFDRLQALACSLTG
jgi:hypothetical protein